MKPFFSAKDLALTQAAAAVCLFMSIPLLNLLGTSSHRLESVLHGLGASIAVLLACQCLHGVYPLLRRKPGSAPKLELLLWSASIVNLLAIIFGNWLYIAYRLPDQAQQWFIYNRPAAHFVLMEYKEFVSLFPLPLGIAAAVLAGRYRVWIRQTASLDKPPEGGAAFSSAIALLVTLMWICLLIGFVLGIGLTKMRMV